MFKNFIKQKSMVEESGKLKTREQQIAPEVLQEGISSSLLSRLSGMIRDLSMDGNDEIIHFGQSLSEAIEKLGINGSESENVKEEVVDTVKQIVKIANSGKHVVESTEKNRRNMQEIEKVAEELNIKFHKLDEDFLKIQQGVDKIMDSFKASRIRSI